MHQCLKFILFGVTLYMFRTVFPSIIRSSICTYSNRYLSNRYCCLLAGGYPLTSRQQYLYWSFRPSSGVQDCTYSNRYLSNIYCCLLASGYPLASRQQYLFDKCLLLASSQQYLFDKCLLLYVQSSTPDDERKTVRNMQSVISN